jgi:hypothetical protein
MLLALDELLLLLDDGEENPPVEEEEVVVSSVVLEEVSVVGGRKRSMVDSRPIMSRFRTSRVPAAWVETISYRNVLDP